MYRPQQGTPLKDIPRLLEESRKLQAHVITLDELHATDEQGKVWFAGGYPEHVEAAKEYCKTMGLATETHEIKKIGEDMVIVRTRKRYSDGHARN